MKRGKDDEKVMVPMFPRLHVNDADKGGPRAPPRNKMALYEQLCIPSHGFNPRSSPCNPVPPPSSSQAKSSFSVICWREDLIQANDADRRNFFPLHSPLAKPEHPEKLHSLENDKSISNASLTRLGQTNEPGHEDDCTVPVFARSQAHERNQRNMDDRSFTSSKSQNLSTGQEKEPAEEGNLNEEAQALNKSSNDSENTEHAIETEGINTSETGRYSRSGSTERSEDVSQASILDSVSAVDLTPDDIVGMIGEKHFWRARKAIVNQQRVFAVQVFELHRLIKVQKLIASSPHLLLEDTSTTSKPSSKSSPPARLMVESEIRCVSPVMKRSNEPDRPNHPEECSAENAVGKPHVFSSKSAPSGPPVVANSSPWGTSVQQPSGQQQWLMPVMSPTEGLVYKPCPGPSFNSTGFGMPYGFSPMMMGEFRNTAYGFPAHQGMGFIPGIPNGGHSYFPSYGMPVMSMGLSGAGLGSVSAVERVNHLTQPTPSAQTGQVLSQEPNPPTLHSSCNNNSVPVPSHTPDAPRLQSVQTTKVSNIPGSTVRSPHARAEPTGNASSVNPGACNQELGGERSTCSSLREIKPGNAQFRDGKDELPLFPTAPATAESDQASRVIRAVPHNARSASASVARIFMFIQEERKQNESI